MSSSRKSEAFILGALLCLGLLSIGFLLGKSAIQFKEYERSVTVKGLAEREVPADVAIWPINFMIASNDITALYNDLERQAAAIHAFLTKRGFDTSEISSKAPTVEDRKARDYGGNHNIPFRYSANQVITVYSTKVAAVREAKDGLIELGKAGISITGNNYGNNTEFLFNGLNDIKPAMIEEATRKAREVAEKFAQDSNSQLGKIKHARQGQFSISNRDSNTPHIKRVRIVSTVEYYLSD